MIYNLPDDLQKRFDEIEVELLQMPYGAIFIKYMYELVLEKEIQYQSLLEWKEILEKDGNEDKSN